MYMLNMVIILIVMYCNVVTAIDKIPTYLLRFNTCTKRLRKCKQNIDRRTKPSLQSLIAAPGFIELVDLVLEYGQNCRGGVAFIELVSKRMRGETLFSLFFIFLEGFFEDGVEIGSGYRGCWRLGGRARSRRLTHDEGLE